MSPVEIILIVCIFMVVMTLIIRYSRARASISSFDCTYKEYKALSEPSKTLLCEYYSIPEANRPHANILNVVQAMDVKHGAREATMHFRRFSGDGYDFTWTCDCKRYGGYSGKACELEDYTSLNYAFIEIQNALTAHEKALAMAGVESGLAEAHELMARAREEAEILSGVTKQLSEGLDNTGRY